MAQAYFAIARDNRAQLNTVCSFSLHDRHRVLAKRVSAETESPLIVFSKVTYGGRKARHSTNAADYVESFRNATRRVVVTKSRRNGMRSQPTVGEVRLLDKLNAHFVEFTR
jgi:hypothetical protein